MCKSFKEKRIRVRKRDVDNCWICNKIVIEGLQDGHPEMATLDHVIEVFRGGGNNLGNLRLAHAKCNNDRSNRKGLIRDWNQYFDNSSPKGTDTISNKLDLLQYIQRINERMSKMEGFQ